MKLEDKVKVKITKSGMNNTLVEMILTICGIEKYENGINFYRGRSNKGKIRYFRNENIIEKIK